MMVKSKTNLGRSLAVVQSWAGVFLAVLVGASSSAVVGEGPPFLVASWGAALGVASVAGGWAVVEAEGLGLVVGADYGVGQRLDLGTKRKLNVLQHCTI